MKTARQKQKQEKETFPISSASVASENQPLINISVRGLSFIRVIKSKECLCWDYQRKKLCECVFGRRGGGQVLVDILIGGF